MVTYMVVCYVMWTTIRSTQIYVFKMYIKNLPLTAFYQISATIMQLVKSCVRVVVWLLYGPTLPQSCSLVFFGRTQIYIPSMLLKCNSYTFLYITCTVHIFLCCIHVANIFPKNVTCSMLWVGCHNILKHNT